MKLTTENYYSTEAEQEYLSVTQYKRFCECEARAMAMIRREWTEEPTTAQLIGSYVDAYFSSTADQFKTDHPEIFKRDGTLKAEYIQADQTIARIERDEMMMKYLSGEKQVIRTGKIEGVLFKIKMDVLHPGKAIVDLKIMQNFNTIWKLGQRLPFVEAWGYDIQGAIYQAVEGQKLPFIIASGTKEREPDIALMSIPQDQLNRCMSDIKARLPRVVAIKKSEIEPTGCQYCDYCKRIKRITEIVNYWEVEYE